MLEVQKIIDNQQSIIDGLLHRGITDAEQLIDGVLRLAQERKVLKNKHDNISFEINSRTEAIALRLQKKDDVDGIKNEVHLLKNDLKDIKDRLERTERLLTTALYNIPNCPSVKSL